VDPSELQRSLVEVFLEESGEGLERAEAGLLRLESDGSRELIDDLFRAVHSIKGGAGVVGMTELGPLAHAMESVLDGMRRGLRATPAITAALLRGVDALRSALAARRSGTPTTAAHHAAITHQIEQLAGAAIAAPAPVAPTTAIWTVTVAPRPTAFQSDFDPSALIEQLTSLGQAVVMADLEAVPDLADLDPTRCYLRWEVTLVTEQPRDIIASVCAWFEDQCQITLGAISTEAVPEPDAVATPAADGAPPAPGAAAPAREAAAAPSSIRVGIDKIDQLINMVGELVITQSMLGELDADGPIDARQLARIREGLGQLARNTRSLQDSVMRLRSMPIGTVFNRFPRLVRELGERLGKDIVLEITGQNTELDKAVLEKLGDPLVHLVRNSIDHGLESVEDRLAAGKSAAGTIRLNAEHRGGDVIVEISDDGRGLDAARIVGIARSKGLIAADATLDDRAAHQLIFLPGFSTAKEVSDLSGRGVGMDVVRRHVKELGGDINLESHPGQGTRITLRLPLTLAIIDGQLIRLGAHQVVIPLLSITESVELEPARTARLANAVDVYRLREQLIPMLDLAQLLALPATAASERRIMVVVSVDGAQIGLLVDELAAQQQVVVKSLESNYQRVPGLAGATILGDGQVAFILDVVALVQTVRPPLEALAA
jgi:two-component system, chemotaxis family, sensor kinase CheA